MNQPLVYLQFRGIYIQILTSLDETEKIQLHQYHLELSTNPTELTHFLNMFSPFVLTDSRRRDQYYPSWTETTAQ